MRMLLVIDFSLSVSYGFRYILNCTTYLDGSHTSVANIVENTANAEADTSENCKSQPVVAYVSVHIDAWSSDEHKQFDEETSLPFLN